MKTKKELLSELSEEVKENLVRIEITSGYLQKKHAESGKDAILHELAKIEGNRKENEEWLAYLDEQLAKENG